MTTAVRPPPGHLVHLPDGTTRVTTDRGAHELGPDVSEDLIRDWTRRGLIQRHIVGRRAWYDLDELRKVEAAVADRTRPRATVVDDETPGRSQSHSTCQGQKSALAA